VNPDPFILARVEAAARSGRIAEAASEARAALDAGMRHPLLFVVVAQAAQDQGRFDVAENLLGQAIRMSPGDAALYTRLGGCLDLARRPAQASEAFDAALRIAPGFAPALDGKARVLKGEGRVDEAQELFHAALSSDPGYVPALLGLAALAGEAGDWAQSRSAATRVLEIAAGLPEAVWALARADLAEREFATAETRLAKLVADPRLTPMQRADVRLMLGEAHHGQGRFAEAFEAWVAGKGELHALYAGIAAGSESETARLARTADWLEERQAGFDAGPDTPDAPDPSGAAGHVFLVGFPRSGTTLIEQVLASHPRVAALEERPTLVEAAVEFLADARGLERLASLSESEAEAWRRRYWRVVREAGVNADGKVFVDKQPAGAVLLPLAAKLFPHAKVLFAIRDPRDVVLSCLRQGFQMNAFTYELTTLEGAARCYDAVMRLAELCRTHLSRDWFDLRLEDLIADFDGRTRALCDFLGLDWSPRLAGFAETAKQGNVRTPSADQVRAGLNDSGVGRWRSYETMLAPVLPILEPWAERLGYALGVNSIPVSPRKSDAGRPARPRSPRRRRP
jgi:Tfp pilus assembly protein PilF